MKDQRAAMEEGLADENMLGLRQRQEMSRSALAIADVLKTLGVPKPKLWKRDGWWWCRTTFDSTCSSISNPTSAYIMWGRRQLDGEAK